MTLSRDCRVLRILATCVGACDRKDRLYVTNCQLTSLNNVTGCPHIKVALLLLLLLLLLGC